MSAYLGALGGLVEVREPSQLRVASARPVSYRTTLGGSRKAQVGPRTNRQWDVGTSAASRPNQLAPLQGFVEGEYGVGPWWWVDPWAQVTNLLPPHQSVLGEPVMGGTRTAVGGPVTLPDGTVAGRHLQLVDGATWIPMSPDGGASNLDLPCVPDVPVTTSWWVNKAGVYISVSVHDIAGTQLVSNIEQSTSAGWSRLASTVSPPEGAAYVRISVNGGGQAGVRITRPALTWTPQMMPWHVGQGAPSVLVTGLDQEVTLAHPDTGGQMAGAGFTIMEVG